MILAAVLGLWIALPLALARWVLAGMSRQNRPALLLASDALTLVGMGLAGMMVAYLTGGPSVPLAGDTYVMPVRPGTYEAQTGLGLLVWSLALLFIGHFAPLGPGRMAIWLFWLIHLAVGLLLLPRIVWQHWGDARYFPLDADLAGSQLMVMCWPATILALLVSLANLFQRWWRR